MAAKKFGIKMPWNEAPGVDNVDSVLGAPQVLDWVGACSRINPAVVTASASLLSCDEMMGRPALTVIDQHNRNHSQ